MADRDSISASEEKPVLPTNPLFKNLTGQRFGRLEVVSYAGPTGKQRQSTWLCRCDCGTEKVIRSTHLMSGQITSCGCFKVEQVRTANSTHGKSHMREYNSWQGMVARCTNPNSESFAEYGARGITICDRWLNSFEDFLSDMGTRPNETDSIDRIDNSKGYEPGNCRWASQVQQCRNTRRNKLITFDGETHCVSEWAELLGINKATLQSRLKTWPIKKALTTKVAGAGRK